MNKSTSVIRPIFLVGMGRSGTTIVFESLAQHPDLGWLSNYCEWMPRYLFPNAMVPVVDRLGLRGRKKQYGRAIPVNRYLPQPDEAYAFWDYYSQKHFSRDYLSGVRATPATADRVRRAIARVMFWQRKSRFAAKLTGPGRITFLSSIFPDARFIHVIRDGRPVVESLLRQRFWREKGGLTGPFWNGTPKHLLREWEASGRNPDVLAALQWRHVVQSIRADAAVLPAESYMELRYEDFVADPKKSLAAVCLFAGLSIDQRLLATSEKGGGSFRNMNEKWREMDRARLDSITKAMQPTLQELGYE